jgi:hypothetical protein
MYTIGNVSQNVDSLNCKPGLYGTCKCGRFWVLDRTDCHAFQKGKVKKAHEGEKL